MKCPLCGHPDSKVIDTRPAENDRIRRRRECIACGNRFTTYEIYELPADSTMIVLKKNGTRELYDRNKIVRGVLAACYKRPVKNEEVDALVEGVDNDLRNTLKTEFTSEEIGSLVMERLKKLDEVAYVRFASVYREFRDVDTFLEEIGQVLKKK